MSSCQVYVHICIHWLLKKLKNYVERTPLDFSLFTARRGFNNLSMKSQIILSKGKFDSINVEMTRTFGNRKNCQTNLNVAPTIRNYIEMNFLTFLALSNVNWMDFDRFNLALILLSTDMNHFFLSDSYIKILEFCCT